MFYIPFKLLRYDTDWFVESLDGSIFLPWTMRGYEFRDPIANEISFEQLLDIKDMLARRDTFIFVRATDL